MATRNIVPRADGEGQLGTESKKWDKVYAGEVYAGAYNLAFNLLQRNKSYEVGDIAYSPSLPSWARLECVTAGTTSIAEISVSDTTAGTIITDNEVRWIIDDIRDNSSVGDITYRPYLKDGYVKADGSTVNRADYPRLVALADKYSLWTDDTESEPWKFGNGDKSTTFVLPNYTERFIEGGSSVETRSAGLPNITGYVSACGAISLADPTRAFFQNASGTAALANGSLTTTGIISLGFNASRSNAIYGNSSTVQPPAIVLIPQMKY